ncbi:MAG: tRNA dihydrouridine synthase DusB [Lachnospiraceae bacterium]|nr:tRNA dihydrouridine synthase DusB [Lachnospiraceae bacterium]MDY2956212.1 tRNA dihydrouridine synthase DusB [Lachnospiraceae bacterium]
MSLKIGDAEFGTPVFLAPMAGVTDYVYRKICHEQGCGGSTTELISAKAVLYKNKNTEPLLYTEGDEGNVGLQLFGSSPEIMGSIARELEDRKFAFVDINMGCPVPKVVNNGEGSALMKDPKLAGAIVNSIVNSQSKPVTVKIRSGFDDAHINAPEVARECEKAGAKAIFVHARTREQYYSGKADLSVIKAVKEAVKVPVIGNGDITDEESAYHMIRLTKCDGIMVGRAAKGNPWIFSRFKKMFDTYSVEELKSGEAEIKSEYNHVNIVDLETRKKMMIRHIRELTAFKGEYIAVREMRKHCGWYTAGIPHATELRKEVNSCESADELVRLVERIL